MSSSTLAKTSMITFFLLWLKTDIVESSGRFLFYERPRLFFTTHCTDFQQLFYYELHKFPQITIPEFYTFVYFVIRLSLHSPISKLVHLLHTLFVLNFCFLENNNSVINIKAILIMLLNKVLIMKYQKLPNSRASRKNSQP